MNNFYLIKKKGSIIMETNNIYELLFNLNPTESQIKEFFIYHCASVKDTMVDGIKYGLELAGKDMESTAGKDFIKEISSHYEEKFAKFVQDSINAYCEYANSITEEINNEGSVEE